MSDTPRYSPCITRSDHARIRTIRRLRERTARDATGHYYIEGVRCVIQAVRAGVAIQTLLLCPAQMTHPFLHTLVARLRQTGVPVLEVTPAVLHSIGTVADPQGIGAVVCQRWLPLDRAAPKAGLCWIALDTVQSPGNLGTILRTATAVGGAGVILLGDGIDPYDPAVVRGSMGAIFAQRLVRTTLPAFLRWKVAHGCLLVGTSPAAYTDYRAIAYRPPTVLLMGGERKGLPLALQTACDALVQIPMVGRSVDSLNLAVATGVLLYELFNQAYPPPGIVAS